MKNAICMLLLTVSVSTRSQIPDYYVYLVRGEASITNPGRQAIALQQKQLVKKTDILSIGKGAELTLVDKSANYFVIKEAGKKQVGDFVSKVTARPTEGVTSKYLKLLFHELLDPNHDFEKLKKENIAGVWGGVSRGDECGNRIYPVNGLNSSLRSIPFKWHKTSPSSSYQLTMYDSGGKELNKLAVNDTSIKVNLDEVLNGQTGKYFWRVTSVDGDCEDEVPIYFNLLNAEDEKQQAESLVQSIPGNDLDAQLQQINKLEKNAFIDVASARYASVVKANAGDKVLARSYALFLLRYGFEEEARAAWKQ